MGKEIERKFLIVGEAWRSAKGVMYRQGYLSSVKERVVRIRTADKKGYLTIKGVARGATRLEFEYEIPFEEANQLLNELCKKPLIEKIRHKFEYAGLIWEIDEFLGDNKGLIIAEVELQSETQLFDKPEWVGQEVTADPRYFNSNLSQKPFSQW